MHEDPEKAPDKAPGEAKYCILSDAAIIAYLRTKMLAGPISAKLISDIRWLILGEALPDALKQTGLYSTGVQGAQAYIDELTSPRGLDIKVSPDDPCRIVSLKMLEISSARVSQAIEGARQ